MTDHGTQTEQTAICPTHGPVDAVLWKGALVCPDPECHRTCSSTDSGTGTERSANTWGVAILLLICGYGAAFGVIFLIQAWNPFVVVTLACFAFIVAGVAGLIALAAMGFDLE